MANSTLPITLTADQLEQLMARYYAGENVGALIREFKLPITASQLIKIFPPAPLPENTCPYCDTPMLLPRLSRTALQRAGELPVPYCASCGHREGSDCRCTACLRVRAEAELAQQTEIRNRVAQALLPPRSSPIRPKDLSLWQALALVALARAGRHEYGVRICSAQSQGVPFAPTLSLSTKLLQSLYEAELIDLSLDSPVESYDCSDEHAVRYDPYTVSWELRLGRTPTETLESLSSLESALANDALWPSRWSPGLYDVWTFIALHECLSYLEIRLHEHGFEFRAGQKTEHTFVAILKNFAIAQVYNMLWCAVRDASAFYLRGGIPKRRAANTIVGNCQRRAERAIAEGWIVKPYRRDYRCPESILTSVFANVATSIGSEQFMTTVPYQLPEDL